MSLSAFGDDVSEESFEGSSSSLHRDDVPTLDETIYDGNLFRLFTNYMKSQQAVGDILFLKDARLFRALNQPREVIVRQASIMVMKYFCLAAVTPVSASEETRKKVTEFAFDPDAEMSLDKNSFSEAFGEVYNNVIPHFRAWISTNEWRDVPYSHIPPPTFGVVLKSGTLRVLFNKYLKSLLERDSDGSASRGYHLWKFCIIANDFRDGKYTHESHLDTKKKKKKGDGDAEDADSDSKDDESIGKSETPEEYAKRLYKKYKHQISYPYDKSMPCQVYIVRALEYVTEEFDKSTLFSRWIALKQYQGVDYQAKIVHQSLTPEGFAEPPSLAAVLTSSALSPFLVLLQGSEQGMNIEFLSDILMYRKKFGQYEKSESSTASSGSADSGSKSSKDMIEEAKRIYHKFLEKGEMFCDSGLVEEVRNLITKNGGSGVTSKLFRKCGTFIYHRSERTWCREARATFFWSNRSYDNHSKNTRGVEEEFSLKNLPENFDLQVVPSIDDLYGNPELLKDYSAMVNSLSNKLFDRFFNSFKEYFSAPIRERRACLDKLMLVLHEAADQFPLFAAANAMGSKELASRERVSDNVLRILAAHVTRACASVYYKKWLVEHASVWKNTPWTPLPAIIYGDLSLIVGMNTVETKIEEAALKGKSGFARYLAKRQMKKQSSHTLRGGITTSQATLDSKKVVNPDLILGPDAKKKGPDTVDLAAVARIPSINDVFSSLYLRKWLERAVLENCLGAAEMELWGAFLMYFKKYDNMPSEKLAESQEEMSKDVFDILSKYKDNIPNCEAMKERAKSQKYFFPQFFRPIEIELYSKYYAMFEEGLRKKGWK